MQCDGRVSPPLGIALAADRVRQPMNVFYSVQRRGRSAEVFVDAVRLMRRRSNAYEDWRPTASECHCHWDVGDGERRTVNGDEALKSPRYRYAVVERDSRASKQKREKNLLRSISRCSERSYEMKRRFTSRLHEVLNSTGDSGCGSGPRNIRRQTEKGYRIDIVFFSSFCGGSLQSPAF